jgi:hypothetical protein
MNRFVKLRLSKRASFRCFKPGQSIVVDGQRLNLTNIRLDYDFDRLDYRPRPRLTLEFEG